MGNEYGGRLILGTGAVTDKRDGTDPAGEADASVQWLLQPRGTAQLRGPQNFDRSIRKGIRLAEYEHVLGTHAEQLKEIFPDGVARLWGATPVKKETHPKGTALREQKVGDEVLFYAEKSFIAKARVLGLFRNPELARAIWGELKDGRTWEHIMALGDISEFKIPAAPILSALKLHKEVRYLTLVRAAERRRQLGLLNSLLEGKTTALDRPTRGEAAVAAAVNLGREGLLRALGTLDANVPGETHTHHGALTLLWSISRLVSGQSRLVPWNDFKAEVGPLLVEFGGSGDAAAPEYPFRHLQSSGLWETERAQGEGLQSMSAVSSTESGVAAGLRPEVAKLLKQPLTRAEAIGLLCATYFQRIDQGALLTRLGLAGYAHASGDAGEEFEGRGDGAETTGGGKRRQVTSSRPDRDLRLVEKIKFIHQHRCQVCGLQLETRFGHYSEAAHIQGLGTPHEGPDKLSNLLCLCPNHHVQFDRLFLFIDEDWNVRRSSDGELIRPLIRRPEHVIDQEYVEYHRGLCGHSRYSLSSGGSSEPG
ncbi:HNH endonuclease [Streptomyces panaciradicis]|uniref:HNH endonuclease n=1 Tax=Streptomyces panaciradicis TaxID=1470261 RepID=UPI00201CEA9E|nr:HNH endonuclease [Streptomyces panaciradicis]MCL6669595.1 HNH endonuclease [Streptomyces panaciradicis]